MLASLCKSTVPKRAAITHMLSSSCLLERTAVFFGESQHSFRPPLYHRSRVRPYRLSPVLQSQIQPGSRVVSAPALSSSLSLQKRTVRYLSALRNKMGETWCLR